ncbi:hypothetical protein H0H81_001831, partial [Sphagnurus paluster]
PDINKAFKDVSFIQQELMETIPSTADDILSYISKQLSDAELGTRLKGYSVSLASKAGGLFEWAQLACAYVNGDNDMGVCLTTEQRFTAIMTSRKDVLLLDSMYRLTLDTIFPKA